MPFSSPPETETFVALQAALSGHGYNISQQVRALDALRAAAARRSHHTLLASDIAAMADVAVAWGRPQSTKEAILAMANDPDTITTFERFNSLDWHPWLEAGDMKYAFKSHFDFVVQAPSDAEQPLEPLFAVEFDGASHQYPQARRRDLAKNRLCAAAGLPLMRVPEIYLHRREHISVVRWLAELWAAYEVEMPGMIAERDNEVEYIKKHREGSALEEALENPSFDVNFVFGLMHPFPAIRAAGERLAARYDFKDPTIGGLAGRGRWRAAGHWRPIYSLRGGLDETWTLDFRLEGPGGRNTEIHSVATVAQAYPLSEPYRPWSSSDPDWRRLEALPAGPFLGASQYLGEALCIHNALIKTEHWLERNAA